MTRSEIEAEIEELETQILAAEDRIALLCVDLDSQNYDPEEDDE